jgi:hypothetical protein
MSEKKLPIQHTTPQDAILAKENGVLREWVLEYLKIEGNDGLAAALEEHSGVLVDIVEFPLTELKKIEGPEPVSDRESLDRWEQRVLSIEELIHQGQELPPLIVTDYWNPLEIADGNHRHEAFLRRGIEKYWTIFFIQDEANKKKLLSFQGKHDER